MTRSLRRTTGLAALALTATLGLAACSDDGDSNDNATDSSSSASSDMSSSSSHSMSPSESMSSGSAAASDVFGPDCAGLPTEGEGTLESMANQSVVTAANTNPDLATFVEAVRKAGLVKTLDTTDSLTVFAPSVEAFNAIPKKQLNALLADKQALTEVLTYHVLPERLTPEELAGTHKTVSGYDLTIDGTGEDMTIGEASATVLCGNIATKNATLYIIDGVLMP